MNEAERILEENRRRDREVDETIYAAWQPAEVFMKQGRERVAAGMLRTLGAFPEKSQRCLEVGCGTRGWLPTLLGWGLKSEDLFGIELDSQRVGVAKQAMPGIQFEEGDAGDLPWSRESFKLVIVSTVLSSILEPRVREEVAREIDRVLQLDGVALIYDFRFNNPSNPNVRRVEASEIKALFPGYRASIRSVTLVPPIARRLVPRSPTLATILETVPFLRSHLLAVMVKTRAGETEGVGRA